MAVILTIHKFQLARDLRDKNNLYVRFKLLGLYSIDQIHTTTSTRKREFMTLANRLTVLTYLCLAPLFIFLIVQLNEMVNALAVKFF